jgi:hypothetical protein
VPFTVVREALAGTARAIPPWNVAGVDHGLGDGIVTIAAIEGAVEVDLPSDAIVAVSAVEVALTLFVSSSSSSPLKTPNINNPTARCPGRR